MSDGLMGGEVYDLFENKPITPENSAKSNSPRAESERAALDRAAKELGVDPVDLATIIDYETAGTYSPSIPGGRRGTFRGLIQFNPENYKKYNVGANQTFESQLENSVVPYLRDRFRRVGRSTQGATLLDLYKTVNGGNPAVSENLSDGNGTIRQHVDKMSGAYRQRALKRFFGGVEPNSDNNRIIDLFADDSPVDLFSENPAPGQNPILTPQNSKRPEISQTSVTQPTGRVDGQETSSTLVPGAESVNSRPENRPISDEYRDYAAYQKRNKKPVISFEEFEKLAQTPGGDVQISANVNTPKLLPADKRQTQIQPRQAVQTPEKFPVPSPRFGKLANDDQIGRTLAGNVGIDLRRKPKGMPLDEYIFRTGLERVAGKYGLTQADIDRAIKTYRSNGTLVQGRPELAQINDNNLAEYLKKHGNTTTFQVTRENINVALNGNTALDERVKKDFQDEQTDRSMQLAMRDPLEFDPKNQDELDTQFRTQDYEAELAKQRYYGEALKNRINPTDEELRKQVEFDLNEDSNSFWNFSGQKPTAEDIENEFQDRKKYALALSDKLDALKAGQSLNDGSTINELYAGQVGNVEKFGNFWGGITRPLASVPGFEAPYRAFREMSEAARIEKGAILEGTGIKGRWLSTISGLTYDLPMLIAGSKGAGLLGKAAGFIKTGDRIGNVVFFGLSSGLETAGQGKSFGRVLESTSEGALTGLLFEGGSKLAKFTGQKTFKNILSDTDTALLSGLTKSQAAAMKATGTIPQSVKNAWIASKLLGETVNIGVIAGGSYTIKKVYGKSDEEAADAAIVNSLFHLGNKVPGALGNLAGKVFRYWKNERFTDVYVDLKGEVKKLREPTPNNFVDAEIVSEKDVIEMTPDKNGMYRAESDTSPVRNTETRGQIETSKEPAQLPEKNPLRAQIADPKAIEQLQTDSGAQKIAELLQDGKAQPVDEIVKKTGFEVRAISEAIDLLYNARQVEILPDNTVRKFSAGNAEIKSESLYEKYENQKTSIQPGEKESQPVMNETSPDPIEPGESNTSGLAEQQQPETPENIKPETSKAVIESENNQSPVTEVKKAPVFESSGKTGTKPTKTAEKSSIDKVDEFEFQSKQAAGKLVRVGDKTAQTGSTEARENPVRFDFDGQAQGGPLIKNSNPRTVSELINKIENNWNNLSEAEQDKLDDDLTGELKKDGNSWRFDADRKVAVYNDKKDTQNTLDKQDPNLNIKLTQEDIEKGDYKFYVGNLINTPDPSNHARLHSARVTKVDENGHIKEAKDGDKIIIKDRRVLSGNEIRQAAGSPEIKKQKDLTRNFRTGTNNAAIIFDSETQRDLYEFGARQKYLMRRGQNKVSDRLAGDINTLKKKLITSGFKESDLPRASIEVYKDVRDQMKGVKPFEKRRVVDNRTTNAGGEKKAGTGTVAKEKSRDSLAPGRFPTGSIKENFQFSFATNREKSLVRKIFSLADSTISNERLAENIEAFVNGDHVLVNEEAEEILRRAIGFLHQESFGPFTGLYSRSGGPDDLINYLDTDYKEGVDGTLAKGKIADLAHILRDGLDKEKGDLIIIVKSARAPRGLPTTLEEERAHRADNTVLPEHDTYLIDNSEIYQLGGEVLEQGAYDTESRETIQREVTAKLFRSDAGKKLNLTDEQVAQGISDYSEHLLANSPLSLDDIIAEFEQVSDTGREFANEIRRTKDTTGRNGKIEPELNTEEGLSFDARSPQDIRGQQKSDRFDSENGPRKSGTTLSSGVSRQDQGRISGSAEKAGNLYNPVDRQTDRRRNRQLKILNFARDAGEVPLKTR